RGRRLARGARLPRLLVIRAPETTKPPPEGGGSVRSALGAADQRSWGLSVARLLARARSIALLSVPCTNSFSAVRNSSLVRTASSPAPPLLLIASRTLDW